MAAERGSWVAVFQSLAQAVVSVFKAELEVLGEQWKQWGGRVGVVVGLFAASAVILASALLLTPYFLTALVQHLSGWSWAGASGLVLFLVLLVAGIVGAVGVLKLKRLDDPLAMTRQRFDDHVGWWRSNIMEAQPQLEEGDGDGRQAK